MVGVGLITRQPEWCAGTTVGGCQIVHGAWIVRLSSYPALDSKQAQLLTPDKSGAFMFMITSVGYSSAS